MASNATTVVDSSRNISRNRANAWISVLLAGHLVGVMFIVANLALASHLATFRDANPPRSIQTIRRFYAGLNDYMETGDATAVAQTLAPGALALVPEDGAMGEDSALLTYLLALRSTAPQRRFSIERIDTSQEIAIASVRRSDTAVSSREFFRVRDDRIVQHWSAAPDSVLRHTLNPSPLRAELRSSAHLVIAELDLPKQWKGPLLIDGPALILIQHGRLALVGDGSSQIVDVASGDISVPGPGERASAGPGQAVLIPQLRATLEPHGSDAALALVSTLVTDRPRIPSSYPADRQPPQIAINDKALMGVEGLTTLGSVQVRSLEVDDRTTPAGAWEIDFGWVVLGPGATLPPAADGEWSIATVISGSALPVPQNQIDPDTLEIRTNTEDRPALALLIELRRTPG